MNLDKDDDLDDFDLVKPILFQLFVEFGAMIVVTLILFTILYLFGFKP